MLKLTITFLAGALTFACLPALAVELPDYGSKNFNPSGDTPSYFANETAPVSARTADTTPRDWSAVDEMVPARPASYTHSGRHGRYAVGRHAADRSAGRGYSTHAAGGGSSKAVRTTGAKHGKPGARHANSGAAHYTMN